jgi:hypothetical protein
VFLAGDNIAVTRNTQDFDCIVSGVLRGSRAVQSTDDCIRRIASSGERSVEDASALAPCDKNDGSYRHSTSCGILVTAAVVSGGW